MPLDISVRPHQLQDISERDHRELPCRDFDMDCYGFDGIIPFGGYSRCQEYMPELGKCPFLAADRE
jgi:hypothetical protein